MLVEKIGNAEVKVKNSFYWILIQKVPKNVVKVLTVHEEQKQKESQAISIRKDVS